MTKEPDDQALLGIVAVKVLPLHFPIFFSYIKNQKYPFQGGSDIKFCNFDKRLVLVFGLMGSLF